MEGGSQSHSPHYHFLHYVETDPLMDHTRGSDQINHTRRVEIEGQRGTRVGR